MSDNTSNHDEDFGPLPAPDVEPIFEREWPSLVNPGSASVAQLVMMGRQQFIAAQNQEIIRLLHTVQSTLSRSQRLRVEEALDELRTGRLHGIISHIHKSFTTDNDMKLHVQRTAAAGTDAQAFVAYVVQAIKDAQADPEDQELEAGDVEDLDKILGHLDTLTAKARTRLYVRLNKEKKDVDEMLDQLSSRQSTGIVVPDFEDDEGDGAQF